MIFENILGPDTLTPTWCFLPLLGTYLNYLVATFNYLVLGSHFYCLGASDNTKYYLVVFLKHQLVHLGSSLHYSVAAVRFITWAIDTRFNYRPWQSV